MSAQLNVATYYGLIKLLGTCASGSASVAETLLLSELPGTLKRLLETSTLFSSSTTSNASVLRSNDQLQEVCCVTSELLHDCNTSLIWIVLSSDVLDCRRDAWLLNQHCC